jgi:cyanophycin synthetase
MKILDTRVYRGPNLYEYRPMIRMDIDLEEMENYPSDKIPAFNDQLVTLLPTLYDHHCSYAEIGGFIRRLNEGTWLGHVIEHIAIELQCLAGTPVNRGKTRSADKPGQYHVVFEYSEEEVGIEAGKVAFDLVRWLLPQTPDFASAMTPGERASFDYTRELERLIHLASDKALGPSTAALVAAAEKRDIPWIRMNEYNLIQFGQGKYQKRIEATTTSRTSYIAVEIAQHKEMTIRLLRDAGLPVPRSILARSEDDAVEVADDIGYPVVTKPFDGNHGRGVSLRLKTADEVREGFRLAQQEGKYVIVEKFLEGHDYRILVIGGEVAAVAERVPGHVVGDGKSTIRQLVEIVNEDVRRGIGHEKILTRIEIDEQALWLLQRAGYTRDTVLPENEIFYLRLTGNLSTGGTAIDRTDEIHYENIHIARRAIQVIGLDIGGVDFIIPDISKPVSEVGGGIVEINAAPGFRMHLAPSQGQPRNVAAKVIDMLFPAGEPSRISLCAITGTNGKTTTTRMVGHIMKMGGRTVGMTTTDGIYLDGERILRGDMTGPWSARVVLREPQVDCAVLEVARGGILREGLGYDRSNVGAVINVQGDHLGLRGVNTLEDLAYVKRLVVETVARNGWSVLNADDPMTRGMADHAYGSICWFTMDPHNELVHEHVRKGGRAVVLEVGTNGDMLTLYDDDRQIPILWSHLIPATFEGHARFNIANALAACAIAYGLGASIETLRLGLRTFNMSFFQTPGRMNVYDEYPFRVVLDFAHNPPAVEALGEFVRSVNVRGRRIGVIGAPGDRRDLDNIRLAQLCAGIFDHLIIREDWDLRGRVPGDVATLLHQTILEHGKAADACQIIHNEFDAIRAALDMATPGDMVVILADDIPGAWKLVTKYGQPETYRRWLADTGQPVPPTDQPVGWRRSR